MQRIYLFRPQSWELQFLDYRIAYEHHFRLRLSRFLYKSVMLKKCSVTYLKLATPELLWSTVSQCYALWFMSKTFLAKHKLNWIQITIIMTWTYHAFPSSIPNNINCWRRYHTRIHFRLPFFPQTLRENRWPQRRYRNNSPNLNTARFRCSLVWSAKKSHLRTSFKADAATISNYCEIELKQRGVRSEWEQNFNRKRPMVLFAFFARRNKKLRGKSQWDRRCQGDDALLLLCLFKWTNQIFLWFIGEGVQFLINRFEYFRVADVG